MASLTLVAPAAAGTQPSAATQRNAATVALVCVGIVYTCIWIVVTAATACLNETPGFARDYAAALPQVVGVARAIVGSVPWLAHPDGTCQSTGLGALMALASGVFVVAILLLEYGRVDPRAAARVVIGVWIVSHCVLLFMPGLLSTDVFAYASYGREAGLNGGNPYISAPSSLTATENTPGDGRTVYGPLWTRIDAAVANAVPSGDPVKLLFAYRMVATLAQVVSLALMWWLTGRWVALGALRSPRVAAFAIYALSPIALFELAGDAHNEGVMLTGVIVGFALLTLAVTARMWVRSQVLWIAALLAFALAALVKFVPLAICLLVAIAWQCRLRGVVQRVVLGGAAVLLLLAATFVVSAPFLDSSDVLRPVSGILKGGEYYRYAWQDSPADILKIKVLAPRLPEVRDAVRTDIARTIVWSITRVAFVGLLAVQVWRVVRAARAGDSSSPAFLLRTLASASAWVLLGATLLLLTQVLAWYFLWTAPMAALLGWRTRIARLSLAFGLSFFVAFYIGELAPFGTPYLWIYAIVAVLLAIGAELATGDWRTLPTRVSVPRRA